MSGSRLSVPPSTGRDNASLPELGAKVHAKGAKLRVKDALMRTFGTGWKNADVEGEVIAKPRKNTRRVRWNIGGQFYETEHGAAFWRNAKEPIVASDPAPEPSNEPQNSRPEAIEEDESFNHDAQPVCEDLDEELNPPDALPASSHETGPSDPLLAHGQQWETLQGGVTECQRAKDGWRYAETRIRWQGALAETVWHDEEACFNHMMPIDFWMDCLQWTNNSLPDNVAAFSEHEHWMCLGVLYARTLHPIGRIKDLWRTIGMMALFLLLE